MIKRSAGRKQARAGASDSGKKIVPGRAERHAYRYPKHGRSRKLGGFQIFSRDRKTRGGGGCLDERIAPSRPLRPGIVLRYARRKVQSSTCIPVGMHTEVLAPPKPTGINSTNWTWFGSWQTSVPYRSSTFLGQGTPWISPSIALSTTSSGLKTRGSAYSSCELWRFLNVLFLCVFLKILAYVFGCGENLNAQRRTWICGDLDEGGEASAGRSEDRRKVLGYRNSVIGPARTMVNER